MLELTPIAHADLCLHLHRMGSADVLRDYDRVLAVLERVESVPDAVSIVSVPLTLTVGAREWHTQGSQLHQIYLHRSADDEGWEIGKPAEMINEWRL